MADVASRLAIATDSRPVLAAMAVMSSLGRYAVLWVDANGLSPLSQEDGVFGRIFDIYMGVATCLHVQLSRRWTLSHRTWAWPFIFAAC